MKLQKLTQGISLKITEESVTEKDIESFYEKNPQFFKVPGSVHASHIVIHASPNDPHKKFMQARIKIQEAKALVEKGELSFNEVAEKYSDCDGNGDLGVFQQGKMVQEFDDVVFNMKDGEVSDVFLTDFGYHITKVHKRHEDSVQALESVKKQIHQNLLQERRSKAIHNFIDDLKSKATISEC
jgi:peptidyl-prolyl cis-trans isomerase C